MSHTNKKISIFSSYQSASQIAYACLLLIGSSFYSGIAVSDQNSDFVDFLNTECNLTVIPEFNLACVAAGLGGGPSLPPNAATASNLGVSGAQNRTSTFPDSDYKKFAEEEGDSGSAAGSEDGSWGLLLTAQYGEADRKSSDLENGYESELTGILIGFDYSFSDNLLAGLALGLTADEAGFDNDAGRLETDSTSLNIFGTWAITNNSALDAYLVYADAEYDNRRNFTIGDPAISGTADSSTDSNQTAVGVGYSRDWQYLEWMIGVYLNLDYLDIEIDAYSESNGLGFDLIYPDQSSESLTSTIGIRFNLDLNNIVTNFRLGAVHEYEDDARDIEVRLVLSPDSNFTLKSDKPDRDYLLGGIGLIGTLNNRARWFIDYERRFSHDFLDTWDLSGGLLIVF